MWKKALGWVLIAVAAGLTITLAVVLIAGAADSPISISLRIGIAVLIFAVYGLRLVRAKQKPATQAASSSGSTATTK